jgi:putative hemin transport protein
MLRAYFCPDNRFSPVLASPDIAPAPTAIDLIDLRARWALLRSAKPKLRIRDAAQALGVPEAALVALGCGERAGGDVAIRLGGDFPALFQALPGVGRVMALTRNDGAVLEHKGAYEEVTIQAMGPHVVGTVIGPIEQRVFFHHVAMGFACTTHTADGRVLESLQFFDRAGQAVTKIYAQDETDRDVWNRLVSAHHHPEQAPEQAFEPIHALPTLPLQEVNAEAFRADYANLQDTHDFFGLLRRHKLHREDALRLAGPEWAWPVAPAALEGVLRAAAAAALPVMIFVGNRGNIQIHQALIHHVEVMGPWLNIMDDALNLHYRTDLATRLWLVRKPTTDGIVTSLEAFGDFEATGGERGTLIAQFFGLRKPGSPERDDWRALVLDLPKA